MTSINTQLLYLQSRKNPLLNAFGKRSILRQALSNEDSFIQEVSAEPKPLKKRRSAKPSPLTPKDITPYVTRTHEMLAKMLTAIEESQAELEALSEAEITKLVEAEQKIKDKVPDTKLNKIMGAYANLEFWAKFPSWSVNEFVALSFELDPKQATYKDILPYENKHDFATQYIQQYELVHRSFTGKEETMFSPLMFIRWAQRLDYHVPNALKVLVKKYQHTYPDPSNPKPLVGGLQNRIDAQAYIWLAEKDPERYKGQYRNAARHLVMLKNEPRDDTAILISMRRGLGLTKQK